MNPRFEISVFAILLMAFSANAHTPPLTERQNDSPVGAVVRTDPKKIPLTSGERAWIASHRMIRVGFPPAFPPLRIKTEKGLKGFSVDYLNLIGEKTGIEFRYVLMDFGGDSWKEVCETRVFDDIEDFADKIRMAGDVYSSELLVGYGRELIRHARNFEIENIGVLLRAYPKLIGNIGAAGAKHADG